MTHLGELSDKEIELMNRLRSLMIDKEVNEALRDSAQQEIDLRVGLILQLDREIDRVQTELIEFRLSREKAKEEKEKGTQK